jgi:glutathione reductase (NADPH)
LFDILSHLWQSNVEKIVGRATFIDPHTVDVDGTQYTADHIVIATGGYPSVPEIPGRDWGGAG